MKHIAPQFELPGTETAFNLAGETMRQPEAKPVARPDDTREMFNPESDLRAIWTRQGEPKLFFNLLP